MVGKEEVELITKKFKKLVAEGKIRKPKINKEEFFKRKADISLRLSKELVQNPDYHDWSINASYYSMFYNAVCLLAHMKIDLDDISDSVHILTYQALVYFFYIKERRIEAEYLEEFRTNMEESDKRLKTLAKQKSDEIISSFRNARTDRGKYTYELGEAAELKSVETAIRRADAFDILAHKLMTS
ncbi:MAG TPA: hypothetical protein VJK72_00265 [Candidatus Nanoarchaeia archaeon]|nr:hypothetical protein [Candidatus Nanoarchaeia archaeon]